MNKITIAIRYDTTYTSEIGIKLYNYKILKKLKF